MILLGVVALTDAAVIGAALTMRGLFAPAGDRLFAFYTEAEGSRADLFMLVTSVLQSLAFLATAVVFIIWFHRVRKNADVFAPDLLDRGAGWAIGSWFIPFAALWIPRGIAAQVWTASRSQPYAGDEHEPRTPVNLWWGAFVIAWLVTRVADRQYERAESPYDIVSATELLVVAHALDILAALLAIRFVHKLTGMQHARALERAQPAPTAAPVPPTAPASPTAPVPPATSAPAPEPGLPA
ncbi:DUF4328 domain-containing protein [Streptomyces sp. NPDC045431]|uniref:DUF4328 domain-containing protein n=1 Tax=Streptomyces sp. NPDC045431 TaxID=3155613 RepID=UPI0033E026F0